MKNTLRVALTVAAASTTLFGVASSASASSASAGGYVDYSTYETLAACRAAAPGAMAVYNATDYICEQDGRNSAWDLILYIG